MLKIDVFWSTWTPKVATRILRDCLAIQRLARVNRADFVIAGDVEMHPMLTAMGIPVTADLVAPTMVRVYIIEDNLHEALADRLPKCEDTEIITLTPAPASNDDSSNNDIDPYAGVKLFKDWRSIPETLPLTKAPPKGPADPMYSPWL